MEFSVRSMTLLLKENTSKRVSEDSAEALGERLEEFAEEVASRSIVEAEDDSRKTVRGEDIRKALLKHQEA